MAEIHLAILRKCLLSFCVYVSLALKSHPNFICLIIQKSVNKRTKSAQHQNKQNKKNIFMYIVQTETHTHSKK